MATDVELPELGESVTEGTITAWLVDVGDTVEVDQPLFELSSDKIDTEVPSPAAGTVTEILVEVDETVEVGTICVRIGEPDEVPSSGGGSEDDGASDQDTGSDQDSGDAGVDDEAVAASETSGDEQAQAEAAAAEDSRSESGPDGDDSGSGGGSGGGGGIDVVLPELGESVTEGTITDWLVAVGDTVEEDQPLFELSSDKIDTEVPSPASGEVSEILVQVDETVEVGTVVARIGGSGGGSGAAEEPADTASGDSAEGGYTADKPESAPSPSTDGKTTPTGSDALASPLVRKLAKEKGLDLDSMEGSGQGGRITREDVEAATGDSDEAAASSQEEAPAPQAAPSRETASSATGADKPSGAPSKGSSTPPEAKESKPAREPGERESVEDLSRIRQRIAEKMLESQGQAAQLTTVQEADVTALMNARAAHKDEFKSREGASLSPFAMVARAALMAMKNHPMVNAYADWDNGKLYKRAYVNLGIAVDTPKGLLVPNIKNADGLTTAGLSRAIAEAAQKARGTGGKRIDFSDIEGGTFTLTNTGSVGVLIDTPILNYPEVAILGVGAIKKRVAVVEAADGSESFGIRHMIYLSLTYDHRLLDGADAARFVTEVKTVLETTDWEQEIA